MNGKQALRELIQEWRDAFIENQLMARLMRSGHVVAEIMPDGLPGFRLTPKGWADIASLPMPELPHRPEGDEITLVTPTGTQCWRMGKDGWELAWYDPMSGADDWV